MVFICSAGVHSFKGPLGRTETHSPRQFTAHRFIRRVHMTVVGSTGAPLRFGQLLAGESRSHRKWGFNGAIAVTGENEFIIGNFPPQKRASEWDFAE